MENTILNFSEKLIVSNQQYTHELDICSDKICETEAECVESTSLEIELISDERWDLDNDFSWDYENYIQEYGMKLCFTDILNETIAKNINDLVLRYNKYCSHQFATEEKCESIKLYNFLSENIFWRDMDIVILTYLKSIQLPELHSTIINSYYLMRKKYGKHN